ncbi:MULTISPECIES: CHAT domain-containing protein [unclassified Streptomyces]|uniref:CHAT domain-containing protein n=1 Tax=unclassified Streptomyces TaxID=2593676 RepID=UPI00093B5679|nr:CHAT domain-containing protein [Streptomyces sp. CB02400]
MARDLPVRIVQDPGRGFTRRPAATVRHPDLVLALDAYADDHVRARVYGTAVPAAIGEYTARLEVAPAALRASAARLRAVWKRELVSYEPVDEHGVPVPDRTPLPYSTLLDFTTEPETELCVILDELVEQGAYLLWEELLGAGGRGAERLRKVLLAALGGDHPLRVRVDSPLFLPWPMLCLPAEYGSAGDPCLGPPDELLRRFLGYRHQIEQTGGLHTDFPDEEESPEPPPVPVVSLNHDTCLDAEGRTRAAEVAAALAVGTRRIERTRRPELLHALRSGPLEEQLMYFWCHGHFRPTEEPGASRFVVQLSDHQDIDAHTVLARRGPGDLFPYRPLVVFNACYAGLTGSADVTHIGGALIRAGAGGVLGPQIEMPQVFAAEYAHAFVTRYLPGTETTGEIMHGLGRHFADVFRNPLGFAYALHCGMDHRLERAW